MDDDNDERINSRISWEPKSEEEVGEGPDSVIRFGEISPLQHTNIEKLCLFWKRNFELIWANFHCSKWPNDKQII